MLKFCAKITLWVCLLIQLNSATASTETEERTRILEYIKQYDELEKNSGVERLTILKDYLSEVYDSIPEKSRAHSSNELKSYLEDMQTAIDSKDIEKINEEIGKYDTFKEELKKRLNGEESDVAALYKGFHEDSQNIFDEVFKNNNQYVEDILQMNKKLRSDLGEDGVKRNQELMDIIGEMKDFDSIWDDEALDKKFKEFMKKYKNSS